MAWNLNTKKNEYKLHKNQSHEVIDIFGFELLYLPVIHQDENTTFGEYGSKEVDNIKKDTVMVYPENTESFDSMGDMFGQFGMLTMDTINLVISDKNFSKFYNQDNYTNATGDLLKLDNGKVFEITGIENEVMGNNNIFASNKSKNVYLLKCHTYSYNIAHDVVEDVVPAEEFDFSNLEAVFTDTHDSQESETLEVVPHEVVNVTTTTTDPNTGDTVETITQEIVKTEDNIFGSIG